jgi:hypothetical protein
MKGGRISPEWLPSVSTYIVRWMRHKSCHLGHIRIPQSRDLASGYPLFIWMGVRPSKPSNLFRSQVVKASIVDPFKPQKVLHFPCFLCALTDLLNVCLCGHGQFCRSEPPVPFDKDREPAPEKRDPRPTVNGSSDHCCNVFKVLAPSFARCTVTRSQHSSVRRRPGGTRMPLPSAPPFTGHASGAVVGRKAPSVSGNHVHTIHFSGFLFGISSVLALHTSGLVHAPASLAITAPSFLSLRASGHVFPDRAYTTGRPCRR